MTDLKIIYCYDENQNTIYYQKAIKGQKYYCIDCGKELVVKEGQINRKHLSHLSNTNCKGTGESIFHKHWKENLFKAGMLIDNIEILEVLNEVSLSKRYNMNWDIDIIVDVLLITEKGDIIVEINYSNPKDWLKLEPYYKQIESNIYKVYEVTVDKNINTNLIWKDMYKTLQKLHQKQELLELQRIKEEKRANNINEYEIFFNYTNKLQKIDNSTYQLKCLTEINSSMGCYSYIPITLLFNLKLLNVNFTMLQNYFKVTKGIKKAIIEIHGTVSLFNNQPYNVLDYHDIDEAKYNKNLYIKLCRLEMTKEELVNNQINKRR